MTFSLLSRHMEEALKEDSALTESLKKTFINEVLGAPSKFNVSFEFLKENIDEILNV